MAKDVERIFNQYREMDEEEERNRGQMADRAMKCFFNFAVLLMIYKMLASFSRLLWQWFGAKKGDGR